MRIRIFLILIIALLILCCVNNCPNGDGSPGSEIGDAVFRSLNVWDLGRTKKCLVGHVALYRNSDGKTDWDPNVSIIDSDLKHSVIQATGEGTELGWQTFQFFLNNLKQNERGYTASELLSVETRKRLIENAKEQYGASYPQLFEEWYYPRIMTPNTPTEIGCFRCDGLVEYIYEQEGIEFFTEEEKKQCFFWDESGWLEFPKFYPEALRKRMKSNSPSKPELIITIPQNGASVETQMSIELVTDDGQNGSGIDRVEIYVDGLLLHLDDEDSDGEKTVHYIWNTQEIADGEHKIKVVSYDRAGNRTEKKILVHKDQIP